MSIQILYQADVLVDGIAASTEYMRIKFTESQPVKDRRAFQDVAVANLPGIYSASADGEFYFQAGSSFIGSKYEGDTDGPTPGAFVPEVITIGADLVVGNIVTIWRGVSSKCELSGQHGEILKGSIMTEAADRNIQAIRLIRATDAVTGSSGTGTAVQLPTPSAGGQSLYSALHIVGTTGGAAGTVFAIISSASRGMPAPTTRVTFVLPLAQTIGFSVGALVTPTAANSPYVRVYVFIDGSAINGFNQAQFAAAVPTSLTLMHIAGKTIDAGYHYAEVGEGEFVTQEATMSNSSTNALIWN